MTHEEARCSLDEDLPMERILVGYRYLVARLGTVIRVDSRGGGLASEDEGETSAYN
jgi:hypothetical protein